MSRRRIRSLMVRVGWECCINLVGDRFNSRGVQVQTGRVRRESHSVTTRFNGGSHSVTSRDAAGG